MGLRALPAIADAFARISGKLETMDRVRDALFVNAHSLQGQQQTMMEMRSRRVELVMPQEGEQEGPTLSDLLARTIAQQGALYELLRRRLDAVMRLEQRQPDAEPGSVAYQAASGSRVAGQG